MGKVPIWAAQLAGPVAFAALALAGASLASAPAHSVTACGERTALIAQLDAKFAEKPQVVGLSADGGVLEVLASEDGSWTILITYPKRPTCVIATGQAFEYIGLLNASQPA